MESSIILDLLRENERKLYTKDELAHRLETGLQDVEKTVHYLEANHQVIVTKRGRIGLPQAFGIYRGQLRMTERGFGFLRLLDVEAPDVYVHMSKLNGALNHDIVFAKIEPYRGREEADIIEVLERANETFVGTFDGRRRVDPDDLRFGNHMVLERGYKTNAHAGDKVVARITKWTDDGTPLVGRIDEVLGASGEVGVDILAVARSFGLEKEFPQEVLDEANALSRDIALEGREDFRSYEVVTIDGVDAKDLDDAIHVRLLENGYELGVHIADVSHYVADGSKLDREAFHRATSAYLLDRVIPMLPEVLSNDLCSLNVGEDRYVFSCIMTFDKEGGLVDHRLVDGVIRSSARLNYDEVADFLEGIPNPDIDRFEAHHTMLRLMNDLAMKLRERRFQRGSVDFDFPEEKIILDETGKPIEVMADVRRISNFIIEEFMLIANETVAEHGFWLEVPFMYRVHEAPSEEKIQNLQSYLTSFGIQLDVRHELTPKAVSALIDRIRGTKNALAISRMTLRTMMQARYSPENEGHFGLAAKYYCHFTAPIRRYPDIFVHRVLKRNYKNLAKMGKQAGKVADHCSERERNAENAERTVQAMKMAEYMRDRIGEEYDGTITSVTSFGFFVELDNLVDGLVHVESLTDDYYEFDEKRKTLMGSRSRKVYAIGDRVDIRVVGADPQTRKIDFEVIAEETDANS